MLKSLSAVVEFHVKVFLEVPLNLNLNVVWELTVECFFCGISGTCSEKEEKKKRKNYDHEKHGEMENPTFA